MAIAFGGFKQFQISTQSQSPQLQNVVCYTEEMVSNLSQPLGNSDMKGTQITLIVPNTVSRTVYFNHSEIQILSVLFSNISIEGLDIKKRLTTTGNTAFCYRTSTLVYPNV